VMQRRSSVESSRHSIGSGEVLPDDAEPSVATPLPAFVASLSQKAVVVVGRVGRACGRGAGAITPV
jgi:hypothetical protein